MPFTMKKRSYNGLGRMVEEAMDENGGNREKAVRRVVKKVLTRDSSAALKWLKEIGYTVVANAHRSFVDKQRRERKKEKNEDGSQPEQLTKDKSRGVDYSNVRMPTGKSGEWKARSEYTKTDIQAQLEMWKATVRGLKPRIKAGERLMRMMGEGETVDETVERRGEEARKAWERFSGQ